MATPAPPSPAPPEDVTRKPLPLDLDGGPYKLRIVWGAGNNRRFLGEKYYDDCIEEKRADFFGLFEALAKSGLPTDVPGIRYPFKGEPNLGEFKPHGHRLMFFRDGNDIVITNGFPKKGEKTPQEEIDRARRIEDQIRQREVEIEKKKQQGGQR